MSAHFTLAEVRKRLDELGVEPKKSLGQNFLVNQSSCERIVQAVQHLNPKKVIEVGPGLGAITELLSEKFENLLLIELDSKFAEYWREKKMEVIEGDALQLDWTKLSLPDPTVLVSNLPYQISSRLVIDRGLGPREISAMVLMFQKEVAQRIMAKPNTEAYGLLTVIAQTFWKVERLFEISSKDFYPPPQVASQVLKFERKSTDLDQKFVSFVKLAFSQRRKFLVKNLSASYSQEEVRRALNQIPNVDEKVRAEVLSPEDFQKLFKLVVERT